MKDMVDYVIAHYALRLTVADLADALNKAPGEIRNQISDGSFPIPVYRDNEHSRGHWYADARDVAEYLDRKRPKNGQEAA